MLYFVPFTVISTHDVLHFYRPLTLLFGDSMVVLFDHCIAVLFTHSPGLLISCSMALLFGYEIVMFNRHMLL